MANRFLDTNFYKSPFVRGLKGALKGLYGYIICDCTPSGIWFLDLEVASLYIGFTVTKEEFDEYFVKTKKAIDLGKGKYFFPDFIQHQYPKGLQSTNVAHNNIIRELNNFNLLDEKLNVKIPFDEAPLKGLISPTGIGIGNGIGKEIVEKTVLVSAETASPEELTKQMVSVYKKTHPHYRDNIHGDTMWCANIAHFIAEEQEWPKESVTNGKMKDVLGIWDDWLTKACDNRFWYSHTIKKFSEHQTWQQFSNFINYDKHGANKQNSFQAGKDVPNDKI